MKNIVRILLFLMVALLFSCNNNAVVPMSEDSLVSVLDWQIKGVVEWQYQDFLDSYYPNGIDSILPIQIVFFVRDDYSSLGDTSFAISMLFEEPSPQNGYKGLICDTNYDIYIFDNANVGIKYYSSDLLAKDIDISRNTIKNVKSYLFGNEFIVRNNSLMVLFY